MFLEGHSAFPLSFSGVTLGLGISPFLVLVCVWQIGILLSWSYDAITKFVTLNNRMPAECQLTVHASGAQKVASPEEQMG